MNMRSREQDKTAIIKAHEMSGFTANVLVRAQLWGFKGARFGFFDLPSVHQRVAKYADALLTELVEEGIFEVVPSNGEEYTCYRTR